METQLYQDRFGVIAYDDARNILELRWFAETETMTDDDYMRWLERYAAAAEQYHVPFTLIDTRAFKHRPGAHTGPWRAFTGRFFIRQPPEPHELWSWRSSFWEPRASLATVLGRSGPRPIHHLGSAGRQS